MLRKKKKKKNTTNRPPLPQVPPPPSTPGESFLAYRPGACQKRVQTNSGVRPPRRSPRATTWFLKITPDWLPGLARGHRRKGNHPRLINLL